MDNLTHIQCRLKYIEKRYDNLSSERKKHEIDTVEELFNEIENPLSKGIYRQMINETYTKIGLITV